MLSAIVIDTADIIDLCMMFAWIVLAISLAVKLKRRKILGESDAQPFT